MLAEADRCKESGQLGAFLRRERIYSSMLASWRKQVGKVELVALAPKKRGPKPDPSARQIQQLNRDNARLRHEIERAKLIIDAQKKLCVALRLPTADETSENEDGRGGRTRSSRRPGNGLPGVLTESWAGLSRSCPASGNRVTAYGRYCELPGL